MTEILKGFSKFQENCCELEIELLKLQKQFAQTFAQKQHR